MGTAPFVPGYGKMDRYRIAAFSIFQNLVSAQRIKDDAEISEQDAQTLVDESIKYAYYFSKYASLEETYTSNLPEEFFTGPQG